MTKIRSTAVYYLAFIVLGMVSASLGPTLPGLAAQTNTDLGGISFLFITRSLGFLVGTLLFGRLLSNFNGHVLIGSAILGMALFLGLVPFTPMLWLLTFILFLLGIAESGIDVSSNTLIVWLHGAKVAPYMNALHFFFGVGAFLSPLIIARILASGGKVSWSYWVLALLVLPITLVVFRVPSPREKEQDPAIPRAAKKWSLIFLLALFLLLYVGAEIAFGGWIYTFAFSTAIASETTAAYLTSAFWGALTIGRLLSIPLTARLRPRTLLALDLLGCLLSIGLMIFFVSATAVWVGTLGFGFSMSSIFPTTLSFAERQMPINGQVTSYIFVGASLGAMTIPWLIGQLLSTIGPQATMPSIFITMSAALLVFVILLVKSRQQLAPLQALQKADIGKSA